MTAPTAITNRSGFDDLSKDSPRDVPRAWRVGARLVAQHRAIKQCERRAFGVAWSQPYFQVIGQMAEPRSGCLRHIVKRIE